jgi:hypothetical protein
MLGPVIGAALYTYFLFSNTFYIFAGVLAIGMITVVFVIPSSINHADDILTKSEIDLYFERLRNGSSEGRPSNSFVNSNNRPLVRSELKTTLSSEVTYKMFLRNRRAMMATVSAVFAMILMLFFDAILTMHLIKDMNFSEN